MRDRLFRLFVLPILLVAGAYTPALAQEMIPLDVRIGVSTNHLPFMIALEEGIYQKNGLDVEHFIPSGTARNAKQDGVTVDPQFVSQAGGTPSPIRSGNAVTQIVQRSTNASAHLDIVSLVSFRPMLDYHVIAQPEITEVEQLKGKRLGFGGGLSHFAALVFAERMGWDPVRDVSLMSNGLRVEDLKSRRVDAIVSSKFRYAMARAAGFQSL